jgi:hypothetical protein
MIYIVSIWLLPVLIAITFHEAAHGFVARFLGDETASRLGRVSLNPIRHIDPFVAPPDCFTGTILISFPDASNNDVGDHAHDRGNDQHHQELAHGCVPSKRRTA